jgi:hypothetical protein
MIHAANQLTCSGNAVDSVVVAHVGFAKFRVNVLDPLPQSLQPEIVRLARVVRGLRAGHGLDKMQELPGQTVTLIRTLSFQIGAAPGIDDAGNYRAASWTGRLRRKGSRSPGLYLGGPDQRGLRSRLDLACLVDERGQPGA